MLPIIPHQSMTPKTRTKKTVTGCLLNMRECGVKKLDRDDAKTFGSLYTTSHQLLRLSGNAGEKQENEW